MQISARDQDRQTGGFRYDSANLRYPKKGERRAKALDSKVIPTWDVNVNDHFKETAEVLHKTAKSIYRRAVTFPTQPDISSATARLIRLRRHAKLAQRD